MATNEIVYSDTKTRDGAVVRVGDFYTLWRITSKSREIVCVTGRITEQGSIVEETDGDKTFYFIGACFYGRKECLQAALAAYD